MVQTISILVSGRVQGVFFRQSTREKAMALQINGYVSNKRDGTVQIIASGTEDQLKKLIDWCHEGPPHAKVEDVTVEQIPPREFKDFRIQKE